jgi:nitroimidazol reductase NimA-like FMN-containing flavoprotein (pyridoxamine 5'-phosphate oxidase superfamily)
MFGKLNNEQIEKVIEDNIVGRLACYAEDRPMLFRSVMHMMPVYLCAHF